MRPRVVQVVQNRIADILGQRQSRFAAVLARDDEGRLRPVKIAKPQRTDIAGTQAKAR